jgi:hypothetical protein
MAHRKKVAPTTQPVSNITLNRRRNALSLFQAYAEGRKASKVQLKRLLE